METAASNSSTRMEADRVSAYTPHRLQLEVRVANAFLHLLDGKNERTYANTCWDMSIGRRWNKRPIRDVIQNYFVAARGPRTDRPVVVSPSLDLMAVGAYLADGRTFNELRDELCTAREQGAWLIYIIHRLGSTIHSTFIETAARQNRDQLFRHDDAMATMKSNSCLRGLYLKSRRVCRSRSIIPLMIACTLPWLSRSNASLFQRTNAFYASYIRADNTRFAAEQFR
ncbi:MAG: hypothetical protein ACLPKT_22130 [Methylocella sp.]